MYRYFEKTKKQNLRNSRWMESDGAVTLLNGGWFLHRRYRSISNTHRSADRHDTQ